MEHKVPKNQDGGLNTPFSKAKWFWISLTPAVPFTSKEPLLNKDIPYVKLKEPDEQPSLSLLINRGQFQTLSNSAKMLGAV